MDGKDWKIMSYYLETKVDHQNECEWMGMFPSWPSRSQWSSRATYRSRPASPLGYGCLSGNVSEVSVYFLCFQNLQIKFDFIRHSNIIQEYSWRFICCFFLQSHCFDKRLNLIVYMEQRLKWLQAPLTVCILSVLSATLQPRLLCRVLTLDVRGRLE